MYKLALSVYSAFSSSDLAVILQAAKGYIGIIVPVAIGLLALLLGIGFIPTIIKRFRYGGFDSQETFDAWNDLNHSEEYRGNW